MKTITREKIIEDVVRTSRSNYVDHYVVKEVLESLDFVVYQYLCDAWINEPHEDVKVKLLDGISVDRKYIPEQEQTRGMFKGQTIPEHYNIKANVSEHYAKKVNDKAKKYSLK